MAERMQFVWLMTRTALAVFLFAAAAAGSARLGRAEDAASDQKAPATAELPAPPPDADIQESPPPDTAEKEPPSSDEGFAKPGRFISEVIDSTYFVEPAEFFALDLPVTARGGARAVHLFGDVRVVGGKHDLIVRLFKTADYQNWLKRRGGRAATAFWVSPRQRAIRLDLDLPAGSGVVLLLDNGYSLRTPKRVRVQLQVQYEGEGGQEMIAKPASVPQEGDITPRANTENEFPPPPPPPPGGGSN